MDNLQDKLRLHVQRLMYRSVSDIGRYKLGLPIQQVAVKALSYATQNKVGMHGHCLTPEVYDAVKRIRPCVVTIMDPTIEWISDIWKVSPDTFIVMRLYEHGVPFYERDPVQWARAYCDRVKGLDTTRLAAVTYNEPFGHDHADLFEPFDKWQELFILELRRFGIEGVANCFGTGNFTGAADRVRIDKVFSRTCKVVRYMGPHDYDWPNIFKTEGYRALRWVQWLKDIEESGLPVPTIIVGEWGLTRATYGGPDLGFRSSDEVSTEEYVGQMREYNRRVCQIPECMGFCPFDWGGGGAYGFESFRHEGDEYIISNIITMQAPVPPPEPEPPPPEPEPPSPEPEPPNGGNNMLDEIRVFKWDKETEKHVELFGQDAEDLVEKKYGAAFRRASVSSGQKVYRLVELWEKTGHSALITQVLDENDNPMANVDVAFYWPDAPTPPDPPTEVYSHDWYPNFVHGTTNVNGDVGPGMGHGAYHGEGEGGPHAVWVRDPDTPSDICEKLGMLAGTFHDHLDQKFKLVTVGEEPSPEEEGMFIEITRNTKTGVSESHFRIEAVGEKRDFYDTRLSLYVVGADPDLFPDPFSPQDLRTYDIGTPYTPGPGEESRTFKAVIEDWREAHKGEVLGEFLFEFFTDEKREYVITVEWQEEGEEPEPEPEPGPEPDGVIKALREKAENLRQDAEDLDILADILEETSEEASNLAIKLASLF